MSSPTFAELFPVLQARVAIDERALVRLKQSLDAGVAPITNYHSLAYGRALDDTPGASFRNLALEIASKPGGISVALQIISMRLYADRSDKRNPLPEVCDAGQVVLGEFEFPAKGSNTDTEDHNLGIVVRTSLQGAEGAIVAKNLCRKLVDAAVKYQISARDYDDLMKGLLQVHPVAVLDELFAGNPDSLKQGVRIIRDFRRFRCAVLDVVPDEVLLAWCDQEPAVRYPLAAGVATLFKRPKEREPHQWTPLTRKLLENAPDPTQVFTEILTNLYPSSWSGSLASKLEGRLKLLNSLPSGDHPVLAATVTKAKADMQAAIVARRQTEGEDDHDRNTRFE